MVYPKLYPPPSYFSPAYLPSSNQPPTVQTIIETTEEENVVFVLFAVCIIC